MSNELSKKQNDDSPKARKLSIFDDICGVFFDSYMDLRGFDKFMDDETGEISYLSRSGLNEVKERKTVNMQFCGNRLGSFLSSFGAVDKNYFTSSSNPDKRKGFSANINNDFH